MESLRRVPYMKNLAPGVLVDIAYNMLPKQVEKDSHLYRADEDEETMVTDEMVIIFDG